MASRIEVDFESLYRPAEARKVLGISPRTLDRWGASGKLTVYRTCGGESGIRWAHRRFLRSEVDKIARIQEAKRTHPMTRAGYPKQPRRKPRPRAYWWLDQKDEDQDVPPPRAVKAPSNLPAMTGHSGHSGGVFNTIPTRRVGDSF